jgi:hypothetical protein
MARITIEVVRGWQQPGAFHCAQHHFALQGVSARIMDDKRLADALGDGVAWVEGFVRVLEDDLRLTAKREAGAAVFVSEYAQTVEADGAAGGRVQLKQCHAGGGFAGAAFADQAQNLAGTDCNGDAIDGLDEFRFAPVKQRRQAVTMHRIPFAQIARFDHRFRLHRRGTFLFRLLVGAPYCVGVRLETPRLGLRCITG